LAKNFYEPNQEGKSILSQDIEKTTYAIGLYEEKRWFYIYARCLLEYVYDIELKKRLIIDLRRKKVDLFTFVHRNFLHKSSYNAMSPFPNDVENLAILKITSYDNWWKNTLKKKERQSVNKAEKSGIRVEKVEINDGFLKDLQKIHNETQLREGRRYRYYGKSLQSLRAGFHDTNDVFGAYLDGKLVAVLGIAYGDRAAMFRQFTSSLVYRDKCPNNLLIAEAVRKCNERNIPFLVYGNHYGYIPSLDRFREHQGFRKFSIRRYYVPLTTRGKLAVELGIHRNVYYSLPPALERALLPIYNYASRIVPHAVLHKFGGE
jgi:hypothetical protein